MWSLAGYVAQPGCTPPFGLHLDIMSTGLEHDAVSNATCPHLIISALYKPWLIWDRCEGSEWEVGG